MNFKILKRALQVLLTILRPSNRAGRKEEEQEQANKEIREQEATLYLLYLCVSQILRPSCFAKTVNFQMETSELYKMTTTTFDNLVDENHPSPYANGFLACMRDLLTTDISRSASIRVWSHLDQSRR